MNVLLHVAFEACTLNEAGLNMSVDKNVFDGASHCREGSNYLLLAISICINEYSGSTLTSICGLLFTVDHDH